mmetsp:Transcript_48312/g.103593  ORF Transcript_48312/g.103593 Transcript_48312/m.103593 type:complete len:228 (-) Transcript_48312:95-778(-)
MTRRPLQGQPALASAGIPKCARHAACDQVPGGERIAEPATQSHHGLLDGDHLPIFRLPTRTNTYLRTAASIQPLHDELDSILVLASPVEVLRLGEQGLRMEHRISFRLRRGAREVVRCELLIRLSSLRLILILLWWRRWQGGVDRVVSPGAIVVVMLVDVNRLRLRWGRRLDLPQQGVPLFHEPGHIASQGRRLAPGTARVARRPPSCATAATTPGGSGAPTRGRAR